MSRKNTASIPQTAPSGTPTTVTSTTSGDHQSLPILSTGHTVQTSTVSETATPLTQSTSSYLTPPQSMASARPLSDTSVATASQARQSPTVDLTSATGTTRIVTCRSQTSPDPSIQSTRSASGQSASSSEDVFAILSFEQETDTLIWSLSGENSNDACRHTIASSSGLYTPPPQASPALALLPHSSQTVLPLSSPEDQDSPLTALSNLLDNVIEVSETSSSSAEQSSTVTQTVDIDTDIDSVTGNTQGALHQALPVNSSALRQSVSPPDDAFPALSLEVDIETEHSTKPLPDGNDNDARRETTAMSPELYTPPPQASPALALLPHSSQTVLPLSSPEDQDSPLAVLSAIIGEALYSLSGTVPLSTSISNRSQAEQSSTVTQTVDIDTDIDSVTGNTQGALHQALPVNSSALRQSVSPPDDAFPALSLEVDIETEHSTKPLPDENDNDARRETTAMSPELYTPPPQASPALALLPHSSQTVLPLSSPEDQDSPLTALSNLLDNVIEVSETSSSSAEQSSTVTQTVDIDTDIDSVTGNTQGALHQALPVNSSALRQSVSPPDDAFPALSLEVDIETEHSTKPLPDGNDNDARRETTAMSPELYTPPPQASPALALLPHSSQTVLPLSSPEDQDSPLTALSNLLDNVIEVSETSSSSAEQSSTVTQTVDIDTDIDSVTGNTQGALHQALPVNSSALRQSVSPPDDAFPALSLEVDIETEHSTKPLPDGNDNDARRETTAMSSGLYTPPSQASPTLDLLLRSSRAVLPLPSPTRQDSPLAALSSLSDNVIAVSEASNSSAEQSSTAVQAIDIGSGVIPITQSSSSQAEQSSITDQTVDIQETRVRVHAERDKMWAQIDEGSSPAQSLMGSSSESSSESLHTGGAIGISLEDSLASNLFWPINEPGYVDRPAEFFAMGSQDDVPHTERHASLSLSPSAASDDHNQASPPETVTQPSPPCEDTADKTSARSADASPPSLRQNTDSESPIQWPTYDKGTTPPESSTTVPTTHETRDTSIRLTEEQSDAIPPPSETRDISEQGTEEQRNRGTEEQDIVALAMEATEIIPSPDGTSHDQPQPITPAHEITQVVPTTKKRSPHRNTTQKKQRFGFPCHKCPVICTGFDALTLHYRIKHSNEHRFFCNICGKGFKLKGILKKHKKTTHSEQRPFQCDICGKDFKLKGILKKHKKTTHREQRPFQCDICGKGFKLNEILIKHKATHSEQRPFQCDICGKDFKHKYYLTIHIKNHSKQPPLKRAFCDEGLKYSSSLTVRKALKRKITKSYSLGSPLPVGSLTDTSITHVSNHQNTSSVSASQSLIPTIQAQSTTSSSLPLMPNPALAVSDQSNRFLPDFEEPVRNHPESEQTTMYTVPEPLRPPYEKSLKRHMTTHSEERNFKCNVCDKDFKWRVSLRNHMLTHDDRKLFQCDICGKGFKLKGILKKHKKTTHREQRPFQCDICGKGFKLNEILIKHKATHSEQRPFQCDICGKDFKDKYYLTIHIKNHSKQPPLKRAFCDEGLKYSSSLTVRKALKRKITKSYSLGSPLPVGSLTDTSITHVSNHQNTSSVSASQSLIPTIQAQSTTSSSLPLMPNPALAVSDQSNRFLPDFEEPVRNHPESEQTTMYTVPEPLRPPYEKSLKRHMTTHSEETNFKCNVCDKDFKWRTSLRKHMLTHDDRKPFQCDICGKGFKQKIHVKQHKATHSEQRPFQCDICGKGFKLKKYLKNHKAKIHSEQKPFQCDICDKGFTQKSHLNQHKKITHSEQRPFQCDICDKGFKLKSNLNQHKKLTHSEQRPFQCDICGKGFKQKIHVKQHKATHSEQKNLKKKRTESYSLSETLSLVPPSDIPTIPLSFQQHAASVSPSQSLVQGIQPQLTLSSSQPLVPNPSFIRPDESNRRLPEIEEPDNTAQDDIYVDDSSWIINPSPPRQDTP